MYVLLINQLSLKLFLSKILVLFSFYKYFSVYYINVTKHTRKSDFAT